MGKAEDYFGIPDFDPAMFDEPGFFDQDNFSEYVPDYELAPGMLLVSAPHRPERSVTLIVQENIGVDLHVRSETRVENVMPEWDLLATSPRNVYLGGPLNQTSYCALAMTCFGVDIESTPHLHRLAPRLALVDLNVEPAYMLNLVEGVRLFGGYHTYEEGEIEELLDTGEYFLAHALPTDVMTRGLEDLWMKVMMRMPYPVPLFALYPKRLDDN